MKKKVTWEGWKAFVRWEGKTDEERVAIWGKLSPARRRQGIPLMREEWNKRYDAERPKTLDMDGEQAKKHWEDFNQQLRKEGIYRDFLIDFDFDLDARTVCGKTKGDPAPHYISLLGERFLLSLGEEGKKLRESLRELDSNIEAKRMESGDALWDEKSPEISKLLNFRNRLEKEYRREWDRATNVGIKHPDDMNKEVLKAIQNAPKIMISLEESDVRTLQARSVILDDHLFGIEKPEDWLSRSEEEQKGMIRSILEKFKGRPIRANNQARSLITKEEIERQKKELQEAVEEFEAAKERIEQRRKEDSAQFGKEGGATKAENVKRTRSRRVLARKSNDAPLIAALDKFRTKHPNCTLPQARDHLAKKFGKVFQTPTATEHWLRDRVERGEIPTFSAAPRGKPPGKPRKEIL